MISISRLGLCGIVVLLAAGSSLADKDPKFGKITNEEWEIGAPADYREADAVVIFSRAHLEVKERNVVTKYHYRIKILTQAGADRVGDQSISWHREYDKVKKFQAHTVTPDDRKHKVQDDAIFTKEAGDYRERVFTFPALQAGCIIEYSYTLLNERFWYLQPWYFQTDIYTLKSTFSVAIPSGFVYHVLYQNVPPGLRNPSVDERLDIHGDLRKGETIKTFTWEQNSLPPITDEPYMSSEYDYRSSLRFQIVSYEHRGFTYDYWESWETKGEHLQKYFDEYCNREKDAKRLAEQVTAGMVTPREKSRAIYDFLAGGYRTVFDYTSRYFAHERMSELMETKSGSGEEKNLLLVRMHQAVDIPAWPVVISTRDHAKFDAGYADLRQFNYLICFAQFGNEYEFIDCSSRLSPYGVLPPNCLADGGLLVDGKQSQLVKILSRNVTSDRVDRSIMVVDADAVVTCSTTCTFSGYYASHYADRYERITPEEFIDDYFMERLDAEPTLGKYECRLDSAGSFVLNLDFSTGDLVTRLDNNLLIKPVGYAYRTNPFEKQKRFFPVDFTYPFTYENVVEILVHDSVIRYELPADTSDRIVGASFYRETKATDSSVVVQSILKIERPEFLPVAYTMLREFFGRVARAGEDEVVATLAAASN